MLDSLSKPTPFSNEDRRGDIAKQTGAQIYKSKYPEMSPETVGLVNYSFCNVTSY